MRQEMKGEADRNGGRVRAVLFDKDGTLLDSLGPWGEALRLVCRELIDRDALVSMPLTERRAIEEKILASIGVLSDGVAHDGILAVGPSESVLAALRLSLDEALGGRREGRRFGREVAGILGSLYPGGIPRCRPMPGADETLRALAELGLPLGLATSDDEAVALSQLEEFGWRPLFVFLSFGDTSPRPKPDPWAALEFARLVGVSPASVAVVGDSPADREMARSAGALLFVEVVDSLVGLAGELLGAECVSGASLRSADAPRGFRILRM
jgi:phosphoglycolate phosphatase